MHRIYGYIIGLPVSFACREVAATGTPFPGYRSLRGENHIPGFIPRYLTGSEMPFHHHTVFAVTKIVRP